MDLSPLQAFKHTIISTIMEHVEKHEILCPQQRRIRKGRFCESQLLGLVDEASETLEKGCQIRPDCHGLLKSIWQSELQPPCTQAPLLQHRRKGQRLD